MATSTKKIQTRFSDNPFITIVASVSKDKRRVQQAGGEYFTWVYLSVEPEDLDNQYVIIETRVKEADSSDTWDLVQEVLPYIYRGIEEGCIENDEQPALANVRIAITNVVCHPVDFRPFQYLTTTRMLITEIIQTWGVMHTASD